MSQNDVYNLLKNKKKWMTTKEIQYELKISLATITQNLIKLFKYSEVFRKDNPIKAIPGYSWKIK